VSDYVDTIVDDDGRTSDPKLPLARTAFYAEPLSRLLARLGRGALKYFRHSGLPAWAGGLPCRHPDFSDLRFSIFDFRDATDAVDDANLLDVRAELIGSQYTNPKILVAAITADLTVISHLTRFISLGGSEPTDTDFLDA
jgi:hypothetical protein